MLRRLIVLAALACCALSAPDASEIGSLYDKLEYRIQMRDGVKLFTIVYMPKDKSEKYPLLITRTPYGISPYAPDQFPNTLGPSPEFVADKFIFVLQDVRGRFESEGTFVDVPILKDKLVSETDTDESTDAYDTIDWLLRNVPNNNGKVGIYGISYNGFYTSCALVRSHPSLLAASPQAPMADLYKGDDAYHNGALFLIANFEFFTRFDRQQNPTLSGQTSKFDFGTQDGYEFYRRMGNVANSDANYLHFKNPYWTNIYSHNTYDAFWQPRNILPHLANIKPAVLVVGGWFDAEDLSGTLKTFRAIQKSSPLADLHLVMGPWSHAGWSNSKGDQLGEINFGSDTAVYLANEIELPFFRHYLKDAPDPKLPKAIVFETAENNWHSHESWPPRNTTPASLYLHAKGELSLQPPIDDTPGVDSYESDPNNPIPFFPTPTLNMARDYMLGDQRFISNRKDVLTYISQPLTSDLILAGPVSPSLWVSTTASDSDFDVKLIDSYPGDDSGNLAGYQQLIRGEPFRGKFRNSFEVPAPFTPGSPQNIRFTMPDVYHCFRKGHRVMVQIQSSWFPLTDRNPQTFTDIPHAKPEQFVKATERIFHSHEMPSCLEILIARN